MTRNHLDGAALTMHRLARGLATRKLALDTGIDITVLNRLEAKGDPNVSTLSLAQFLRIADRLHVDARHLLKTTPEPDNPEQPDDPPLLGALLTELGAHTQTLIVAEALAWTVPRVHAAADALTHSLAPAGLTIYRDGGRISIRPLDDRHQDATVRVKQDPRLPYSQRIVTPSRARKVFRAIRADLVEQSFGENDRLDLVVLKRVGILDYDDKRNIIPTADVLRSLYPTGDAPDR